MSTMDNLIATVGGISTSNLMGPTDIVIGSELSATNGAASANQMNFQYNQWLDPNGVWHYQTAAAENTSTNAPPNGWWSLDESQQSGGVWSTDCC